MSQFTPREEVAFAGVPLALNAALKYGGLNADTGTIVAFYFGLRYALNDIELARRLNEHGVKILRSAYGENEEAAEWVTRLITDRAEALAQITKDLLNLNMPASEPEGVTA